MDFNVAVSTDNATGQVLAVYFRLRSGKVGVTRELVDGKLFADYNRRGQLLGIEMLSPCSAKVLDAIDIDEDVRLFVKRAVPREFIDGTLPLPKKMLSTVC